VQRSAIFAKHAVKSTRFLNIFNINRSYWLNSAFIYGPKAVVRPSGATNQISFVVLQHGFRVIISRKKDSGHLNLNAFSKPKRTLNYSEVS